MNMAQMMISVFDRVRILWEKDKCLQNIFKILLQLYESPGLCGKGLKPFTPQILILTYQQQAAFENIVGKGEIARNERFLLFPQCFLLNKIIVSPFVHIFEIISLSVVE